MFNKIPNRNPATAPITEPPNLTKYIVRPPMINEKIVVSTQVRMTTQDYPSFINVDEKIHINTNSVNPAFIIKFDARIKRLPAIANKNPIEIITPPHTFLVSTKKIE